MNQWSQCFRKLSLAEKVATVTSVLGGIGFIVAYIASTDIVQKIHIKQKLLDTKFPMPPHMNKVDLIEFDKSYIICILKRLFCKILVENLHFTRG